VKESPGLAADVTPTAAPPRTSQPVAAIALARVLMLAAAVLLARFALGRDVRTLKRADSPGTAVAPAVHGVLIDNLKSSGGRPPCRSRPHRRRWPLLPAAPNRLPGGAPRLRCRADDTAHLALDLGLDRRDVLGALDAYGEAQERRIDIGDVNGRASVNNVSLGLYATIVRSPDYRDAKIDTALSALPTLLGPGSRPFDLSFRGPRGEHHAGAHLIEISNNPYQRGSTTRPRLDTGRLGVLTLEVDDDKAFGALLAATTTGNPERFPGLMSWTAETFEVTSHSPVDAGLDGEAVVLDPPLRFSIRPTPLHVRLPKQAIGYSPPPSPSIPPRRCAAYGESLSVDPLSRPSRSTDPRAQPRHG
jgi:hypothetical protein